MAVYAAKAIELGSLVESKQKQYGNSTDKTGKILAILYPGGVPVHAYMDMMLITRVLDKLSRITQRGPDGLDLGGESPWKDVAGYGMIGWKNDDENKKQCP